VHRKGATRAFPGSSPDVPTVYRSIGQPVFIPGSMENAQLVLVGLPGGHGALVRDHVPRRRATHEPHRCTAPHHGRRAAPSACRAGHVVRCPRTAASPRGRRSLQGRGAWSASSSAPGWPVASRSSSRSASSRATADPCAHRCGGVVPRRRRRRRRTPARSRAASGDPQPLDGPRRTSRANRGR
jgi:tRNA-splicing ligase RtcB